MGESQTVLTESLNIFYQNDAPLMSCFFSCTFSVACLCNTRCKFRPLKKVTFTCRKSDASCVSAVVSYVYISLIDSD